MSSYKGPERRASPTPEALLAAVSDLASKYKAGSQAAEKLAQEVGRRKRETRYVALGVVIVVAIAVCSLLVVRHHDRATEQERRERLAAQIITQRENLIAGCERGNESRRTLTEVISRAVQPSSTPPATEDPELLALLEQSRERTLKLRAELLALPGVQLIDCASAYPVPELDR